MKRPDTSLAKEGLSLAQAALPRHILDHSHRVYLLGRSHGEKKGIAFDDEGLWLASLFHDFGLVEAHRAPGRPFPVGGSRALEAFLTDKGVERGRIAPLADAIEFHMQIAPRWSRGNVAGLLQIAAWTDVIGLRRLSLWKEAREVEKFHPRDWITWRFLAKVTVGVWPWHWPGLLWPRR